MQIDRQQWCNGYAESEKGVEVVIVRQRRRNCSGVGYDGSLFRETGRLFRGNWR